MWYTHAVFAALLFLTLKVPLKFPWLAFPVCVLASLIPDIDHHKSKIGRKMSIISRLVELIFSHRGLIHSLVAAVAFSVFVFVACYNFGIGLVYSYVFFMGYASHLFLDSLNPRGIAWLAPLTKLRLRSYVKTNSISEILIFVAVSGLTIANIVNTIL